MDPESPYMGFTRKVHCFKEEHYTERVLVGSPDKHGEGFYLGEHGIWNNGTEEWNRGELLWRMRGGSVFLPDGILDLGTNSTKPNNWKFILVTTSRRSWWICLHQGPRVSTDLPDADR